MSLCNNESSLPPDELWDLASFFGISCCVPYVFCGGGVMVIWIYCPMSMCDRVFVYAHVPRPSR